MGLNNDGAIRLFFDIETCPLPEAASYIDTPKAPSNWKDPEKIKAHCAEKQAEQLDGAGLDCDLCQIAAIGWMREDDAMPTVVSGATWSEAEMLTQWWAVLGQRTTVGFNSLGFDLIVLLRRSLYLGVPAPSLNLDRYRTPHLDLMQKLSFNGALKARGLSWYCKRFGLDVADDPVTGKDIAALVAKGQWADVILHCQRDVVKTAALARRCGYCLPQPAMTVNDYEAVL